MDAMNYGSLERSKTYHDVIAEVVPCCYTLTMQIETEVMPDRIQDASFPGSELLNDIIYTILTAENICCTCL